MAVAPTLDVTNVTTDRCTITGDVASLSEVAYKLTLRGGIFTGGGLSEACNTALRAKCERNVWGAVTLSEFVQTLW